MACRKNRRRSGDILGNKPRVLQDTDPIHAPISFAAAITEDARTRQRAPVAHESKSATLAHCIHVYSTGDNVRGGMREGLPRYPAHMRIRDKLRLSGSCTTSIATNSAPYTPTAAALPCGACTCICASVKLRVLHGESSKRLAPPRNTKDRKHLINPIDPTDTPHRPSTKHYRRTARETHNTK